MKVPYTIILVSILFSVPEAWASETRYSYMPGKPEVLHTLSGYGRHRRYDSAEVFLEADNHVIVLCSFGFWDGGSRKKKTLLLVYDKERWIKSEISAWHGIINNGVFQVCRLEDIKDSEATSRTLVISTHGLTSDMGLSSQPTNLVKMYERKKVFKREKSRQIKRILPLDTPDKFFIMGRYTEHRLNPVDLIGLVMSAGHWGFVQRLFGATIEQDRITGYYNTPEKPKTGEYIDSISSVYDSGRIHSVWLKSREYSPFSSSAPQIVQYASFDLSNNRWAEPTELFQGYKYSKTKLERFSPPSLACDKENVYCTWSWSIVNRTNFDKPIREEESGVYFCNKGNDKWNKPIKIVDLGLQPRVVVDNGGTVYVFWIERNEGLFYNYKTDHGWSENLLAVEGRAIRVKETGVPAFPDAPFAVAVDKQNNFHIAYIRARQRKQTIKGYDYTHEELVYLKLTSAKK